MKITKLKISNIKSFPEGTSLDLSPKINLLVGPNNSGKSIVIKALYALQESGSIKIKDLRINSVNFNVGYDFDKINFKYLSDEQNSALNKEISEELKYYCDKKNIDIETMMENKSLHDLLNQKVSIFFPDKKNSSIPNFFVETVFDDNEGDCRVVKTEFFPNSRPKNYIVPFFANRKSDSYGAEVTPEFINNIETHFYHLNARIVKISNPDADNHEEFRKYCKEILGFHISTYTKRVGIDTGLKVSDDYIDISDLGQGVPHIVALIYDLVTSKDKLFLIEELENDIHPAALKKLLNLIIEKSENNQFVISTHSNIVVKYLGSESETKIFETSIKPDVQIPTTEIKEIKSPDERLQLLQNIGYELIDYDFNNAWLLLEEQSIETIINSYLIPVFCPSLIGKLKTIETKGVGNVVKRFNDLNDIFIFTHLTPAYLNKVWVLIDGGKDETEIIKKLKDKYVKPDKWKAEQFINLKEHDFEDYFPAQFDSEKNEINQEPEWEKKKALKKKLLFKLIDWINTLGENKKAELQKHFGEIIIHLQKIESVLNKK